jgi:5'-3' exonuclease
MAQLISENVSIYFCDLKTIVNLENYNEFFKPHQKNALLVKILCGDDSDCIKGIKGNEKIFWCALAFVLLFLKINL